MTGRGALLLVDDDESGRFTLACVLEDAGFSVVEAASLDEARACLERDGAALVAAVVDLHLPDGNGAELLEEVRARQPGARLVIASGAESSRPAGADAYFTKGEDPARLIALLQKVREEGGAA